ncbi:MAG: lysoplasmalogenase [Clostridia bacterium]|nr:lysoplasmalogenase [Clostridia bacterium]MDE7079426.1 lysoplasmalogenase [Clostridia bacterium]
MEVILYILVAVCLIFGVLKAHSRSKGNADFELIAKTCGALTFVCLGILAFYLSKPATENMSYGLAVIIALVLGMLGDIFLCLDDANSHPNRKNLIQAIGVLFFFLGHICYMINMLTLEPLKLYLLPTLLVFPLIYVILCLTKVLTSGLAQNILLAIYFLALNIILVSAINLIIIYGATAFTMLLLFASALFISSDIVLGLSWFAPKAKLHKNHDYYIILSYFTAQCLFALSVYFV